MGLGWVAPNVCGWNLKSLSEIGRDEEEIEKEEEEEIGEEEKTKRR